MFWILKLPPQRWQSWFERIPPVSEAYRQKYAYAWWVMANNDAIFDEGVVSEIDHPVRGKATKPPILAWAALKLHESNPSLDFLKEVYPSLART
jgi:hypothetical protein